MNLVRKATTTGGILAWLLFSADVCEGRLRRRDRSLKRIISAEEPLNPQSIGDIF